MRDGTKVGLVLLVASALLAVLGLVSRRAGPRWLLWLGLLGLAISAGWIALGLYIDSVVR